MQNAPKETKALGGRLPLLKPEDLSPDQASLYDLIMKQFVPALNAGDLQSNTSDGRFDWDFPSPAVQPRNVICIPGF